MTEVPWPHRSWFGRFWAVFPQAVCRKASAEEAGFYALNEKTALHVFGSAVDRSSSKAQALGVFLEESAYTEPYQRIRHPVQPELFAMKSLETARTLFGGEMRLSPSKLDRYHQGRFAYFARGDWESRNRGKRSCPPWNRVR